MTTRIDPRVDAERYLQQHDVKKLFKDLGTRLLYERPIDPNAFLIKVLQEMKQKKPFFTEQDVRACFDAYDINSTGTISDAQYLSALKNLGIDDPAPLDHESIGREAFITKVTAELAKAQ